MPPACVRGWLIGAAQLPELSGRLVDTAALTVRLTGDRELHRLNRVHLGEDHATDVLSFPAGADSLEPGYLGDLAISWPAVLRQAAEHGHPSEAELALLCIHGFLHLLGWDHVEPADAADMERLTVLALTQLDVALGPARLRLSPTG